MRWAEIIIEIPAESAEAVTEMLLEAGCQGVAESVLASTVASRQPEPDEWIDSRLSTLDLRQVVLTGFLPVSDDLQPTIDRLENRLAQLPDFGLSAPTDFTLKHAEDTDWAHEWRKHFKPLEIGRRLVIKPSWETYAGDPERVVVELDPGMAFGTGGHPTTRLCLAALEDYVTPGCVVADIGTGSGILALAAARLGASVVHATDIDLLPRQTARENVARSGLEKTVHIHEMEAFDVAARECDVVVANIIAATIIQLSPSVYARLKPGGVFIASGIVEERLPDVRAVLDASGFRLLETREEEIWRATIVKRDA